MYRWYENATLCYAYLADVEDIQCEGMINFKRSRYWTRGWTLQELIAPNILIFFSSGWIRIGTRLDLRQAVAQATYIPKQVLSFRNISDYSVSQKMSVRNNCFFKTLLRSTPNTRRYWQRDILPALPPPPKKYER